MATNLQVALAQLVLEREDSSRSRLWISCEMEEALLTRKICQSAASSFTP